MHLLIRTIKFKRLAGLVAGIFCVGSAVYGQSNTNRPVFIGPTNLSARVGQEFRYQVLIGGTGRQWVGSDTFTNSTLSNVWTVLTNTNGRLANANGQLNLVASNASGSNPAVSALQWVRALPRTNSWLAYMQVVVSNDLPVTSGQSATAGMSLFQSNRPSGSLIFTNTSEALLLREDTTPNRKASSFLQNNSPFTATFASNTLNFYQRQAGPANAPSTAASLVLSNRGSTNSPTNTFSYRSSTNSTLTNSDGQFLGVPGPATAVASPAIILPSNTNWSVTVRVHYGISNFLPTTYVGPAIVKNSPNASPMQMFSNRVSLALVDDPYGLYVASEAYSNGDNISGTDGTPWVWLEDQAWLNFRYDASTALLYCSFFDTALEEWIDTDEPFNLNNDAGNLGADWGFIPGVDTFRLLLAADTSNAGGNSNGADPVYFADLEVSTDPAEPVPVDSDASTLWIGLSYDAFSTNLTQQFSLPGGAYTELTPAPETTLSLANWGTNASTSPLQLRIGAQGGQTNLPLGAVAMRTFAVIPAPGDMDYAATTISNGLTLDADYGVVSGTPIAAGTNTFTLVASNPFGGLTATQTFRVVIAPTLPILAVTSNGILKFGVTNTNAITVEATNYPAFGTNPLNFTAAGLPAGLILSNQAGGTSAVVRGAPTAGVGTNRVVFTASNSSIGAVTITSIVTVEPGAPALRLVQNRPVPRYSTSAVVSTTLPFWTLSNSATGQNQLFTNLFTANANFPSNALRLDPSNGQILAQTNRITNAGNFTNVVFTLSNAGGTATLTSSIVILPATNLVLTLATNPPFPSNGISFGAASTNFFQLLVDTNVPGQGAGFTNTFALQSGPSGIRINPTNGIVFGTNNQAGNFTLRISARNLGGFTVTNISLGSKPPAPLFRVVTNRAQFASNSTNALVMSLTNVSQLNTNAYPVTWSATNLPPGFSNAVVGTNFVIRSANPTEVGIFSNITVVATNAGGATTNSNITLEVLPAIPALSVASNGTYQYEVENTNGIEVTVTNTNGQNISLFPVSFSAANLPGGWTLITNGGGLVGVIGSTNPTVATNVTNLLITATNKGGARTTNLTLRVLPEVPTISVVTNTNRLQFGTNSTNAVNVVVGSAGQNTNNFPIGFLASNLPTGVQFTTNATNRFVGVIGGTNPTQAGIFTNVVLIITNAAGTNTETISLTVLPAAPRFSVATNRAQFGSNSTNPVVVTVTNTNGQNLTDFPLAFALSNMPGGISLTNTNAFTATAGSDSPSVATNNASFVVVVTNAGGSSTTNVTGFRILPALPELLAATNGDFQYQTASAFNAVTVALTNTNGQNTNSGQFPVGFSATNLPAGVGFSTNGFTFNLTGTPTVVGIFTNITVRATNLAGTNTTNLTLRLLPAAPEISRGPITTTRYQVSNGTVVFYNIVNTNGQNYTDFPISYAVTNLPAGLQLTTNTTPPSYRATIGGTPTTAGIFTNITVSATNAGGAISQNLQLTILPSGPALTVLSNNPFQYGVSLPNGLIVAATNTNALFTNAFPVSFSLSGVIPAGIGLTSTNYTTNNGVVGSVGGTNPTQAGTFTNVVVTAANAGGTNTTNLTVSVLSAAPLFTVTNNRTQFGFNSPNALVITVTNSNAITTNSGLSFQITGLPAGLALTNTNGFVARAGGTNPSVATNVTVTVEVTNEGGATSDNYTFSVLPAAPLFSVATNSAQYGEDSPNALVVTVTNTNAGAQNTDDFPDFGFSVSPSLSGLDFTNTNGFVATYGGTNPAVATNATLTVTVTNAGGTNTTNVSLAVLPALPLFSVTNNRTQFAVNSTNALVVTVTNTSGQNTNAGQFPTFTFSSPSLPGGLAFLATNGLTARAGGPNPSLATNAVITVVVSNAAGATTNTNISLTILPAAPLFSVVTNRTQYGADSSNALVVTVTNTNGGAQNLDDFPDFGFSVSPSLSGLDLTNTNGLEATYGGTNPAVVTNATLTVTVTNAGGTNTTNVSLAVLPALPLFSVTNNRTQFGVNSSNALVVTVTNTEGQNTNAGQFPNFTFSSTNLPIGGIAFTNTNGLIGTAGSTNPTLATNATITVVVSNAAGATTNSTNLTILPAAPLFSVVTNSLQFGVSITNALVVTVINTNGGAQNTNDFPDFGFVSTNLSDALGLAFTNTNGLRAVAGGIPDAVPVTNAAVTITVTNAGGTNTTNLTLRLLPAVPTSFIYVTNSGPFRAGQSSATLTVAVTAGQNTNQYPITYDKVNLPTGLTFNTNSGLASGTPSVAATFPAVFTASNAAGTGTNTNAITVEPGAPELDGPSSFDLPLTANQYFQYQISARGAGQIWAGRSFFTNSLDTSWFTNGASNSGAFVSTNTNGLRYAWFTTNSNAAFITWKWELPLDSAWQASARVIFASNGLSTNLAGLAFSNANQYLAASLIALKDSNSLSTDYSLAQLLGDTDHLDGVVEGQGATNGAFLASTGINATGGSAFVGLEYSTNGRLVSLANPDTNPWTPVFTNVVTSWTNAANTNTLVLRLQGSSYAPTKSEFSADFDQFVVVPLGNLTYTNLEPLPTGVTLNPNTGLISGIPTVSGTNTNKIVISNSFGTVTNEIIFQVP